MKLRLLGAHQLPSPPKPICRNTSSSSPSTQTFPSLLCHPALTFIFRFFFFLIGLRVISRIHLFLQSLQFALVVLGKAGRERCSPQDAMYNTPSLPPPRPC